MVIRILAISGSLRAGSVNSAIVQAAGRLAPEGVEIDVYDGLADLPHFNPDLDHEPVAAAVTALRERAQAADGVLLCVPEYAFGIPGSFKNALDWTVRSGELAAKPVAVVRAAHPSRGARGNAALRLVLSALSAEIFDDLVLSVPVASTQLGASGELRPSELEGVRRAVAAFARSLQAARVESQPRR